MAPTKKEGLGNDGNHEGSDRREFVGSAASGRRIAGGLTERLRDALRDGSDDDLLLDRSDVENGIMQWVRALDLHVLGGCRVDERLKPLLKLDISNGVAEDRLMAQLSQHFDASEVAMLARCLCVPLVSFRVGKVIKEGSLLCPTTTRGHLNLTLLPSSDMHITFTGADGCTERLATLRNTIDCSEVVIEEILADSSGRSFLLKLSESQILYFWCSEKSKLNGMELLGKMKDLLRRKPTLSHLTGIHESRLESFATHLRAYLHGSLNAREVDHFAVSYESLPDLCSSNNDDLQSASLTLKSTCYCMNDEQPSHDVSPGRGPNIIRDETTKSSSSIRSIEEEFKLHRDNSSASFVISRPNSYALLSHDASGQSADFSIRSKDGCNLLPFITQPELPCASSSCPSSIPSLLSLPPPQSTASKSLFSPYYCWCPPCPSLHYSSTPSCLPTVPDESLPFRLLSSSSSSAESPVPFLPYSNTPFDISKLPALNFPLLPPESFARLPFPVPPLVTLPSSQQISTFTPFIMSDPIVHTPVIDVCSSGQGYLVSGGPAISSAIPPLIPNFVNRSLVQNTESAAEKSARETLMLLMASTPASACQKLNSLPPFLTGIDDSCLDDPGSNNRYKGILGFEAAETKASTMQLLSTSGKLVDGESGKLAVAERSKHGSDEGVAPEFERCDGSDLNIT